MVPVIEVPVMTYRWRPKSAGTMKASASRVTTTHAVVIAMLANFRERRGRRCCTTISMPYSPG